MRKTIAVIAILLVFTNISIAEIIGDSDPVIETIATPILDDLLAGFNDNDYVRYSKYFDKEMLNAIPEEKFKITREQILYDLGGYISKKYLGYLNQNNMTIVLYKGKYDKFNGDVLIKLVLIKEGDKYFVKGLWFQ